MSSTTPFPTSSDASMTPNTPETAGDRLSGSSSGMSSSSGLSSSAGSGSGSGSTGSSSDIMSRVVGGAHQTIDRLAESAAPHVDQLGAQAERWREVSDEWTESLRVTVRENPLASVAVALAVGVLIAKVTR